MRWWRRTQRSAWKRRACLRHRAGVPRRPPSGRRTQYACDRLAGGEVALEAAYGCVVPDVENPSNALLRGKDWSPLRFLRALCFSNISSQCNQEFR